MNICVTGFAGSGSSAVIDLLEEYSCNTSSLQGNSNYEHVAFYFPGGLFDLEKKLLETNDMYRSDEAIVTFKSEMNVLNKNNFGWFGSYEKLCGDKFNDIVNEFIENLNPIHIDTDYYWQCKSVHFSIKKVILQLGAKLLLGRTIYKWGRQYDFSPNPPSVDAVYPTTEEFYICAKKFVKSYMKLFERENSKNTIFDRLLLIYHLDRIPKYFDDDFRIIVVKRDVRDIFILNKYIWPNINANIMYPTDVNDFIKMWKGLNRNINYCKDARILYIDFEDLIYKYSETISIIQKFCGLSNDEHDRVKKYFQPERSIKNTQLYQSNKKWQKEIEVIERELPEYTYQFPYINNTSLDETFDNSRIEVKHTKIERITRKIVNKFVNIKH